MKTLIVGNGIIGLTTALRLAQRGDAVTVIGDPARTGSATLAAAAMLSAFGEVDAGVLATDMGRMKLELGIRAGQLWTPFAEEIGGVPWGGDTFILDSGGLDDAVRFDAIVAALREYNARYDLVRPSQVPAAPLRPVRRAVKIHEGSIDPRGVIAGLDVTLERLGVERIDAIATRVRYAEGSESPWAIELADGRVVEGTHAVLANGAQLTKLLDASALPIEVPPVLYGVGSTLEVAHWGRDNDLAILRGRGVYLVTYEQRIVVGSTSRVVAEPVDDAGAAKTILDAAAEFLDHHFADAEVLDVMTGWRPTTADGYPLIGMTRLPGLAIASGTRRDGFHLAPVIAEQLAAVLHGERGDPRFRPFSPERDVQSQAR